MFIDLQQCYIKIMLNEIYLDFSYFANYDVFHILININYIHIISHLRHCDDWSVLYSTYIIISSESRKSKSFRFNKHLS